MRQLKIYMIHHEEYQQYKPQTIIAGISVLGFDSLTLVLEESEG